MSTRGGTQASHAARMMLALDALNCEPRLIDTAVALAAALGAELDALFVEDDDLYAAAELPITQEISLVSARERELSAERLAAALSSLAGLAEARFRAIARGRFRVMRARRAEALSAVCTEVDLLLVPAQRALVRVQAHLQNHARLLVLSGAGAASVRTLDLAAVLARRHRRPIEIAVTGDVDLSALEMLRHPGVPFALHRLPAGASLAGALTSFDARAGDMLLVAADLPMCADRAALLEALSRLRCQTLLVN